MWKRAGLFAAWAAGTLVSILVAGQAVGGVRDQVTDRPAALPDLMLASDANVDLLDGPPSTPIPSTGPATTEPEVATGPDPTPPATITSFEAPSASTSGAIPSSSPAPPVDSVPPTSPAMGPPPATEPPPVATTSADPAPPTTTAPSTTLPATSYETYQLIGGWVRLAVRPGAVSLDGAGANPGFVVEADNPGPDDVEVEFRSEVHESELRAGWEHGVLDVEIRESPED